MLIDDAKERAKLLVQNDKFPPNMKAIEGYWKKDTVEGCRDALRGVIRFLNQFLTFLQVVMQSFIRPNERARNIASDSSLKLSYFI